MNEKLVQFLNDFQRWNGNLVATEEAWPDGAEGLPKLTHQLEAALRDLLVRSGGLLEELKNPNKQITGKETS